MEASVKTTTLVLRREDDEDEAYGYFGKAGQPPREIVYAGCGLLNYERSDAAIGWW